MQQGSTSRLVANQVKGKFVYKEDSMSVYIAAAQGQLEEWKITQVRKESNGEANTLAKLGVSSGKAEEKWIWIKNQERSTRTGETSGMVCGIITAGDGDPHHKVH